MIIRTKFILLCGIIFFFIAPCIKAEATPLHSYAAVIHVHTAFDGSGKYDLDTLVRKAKQNGIRILVPTDHDLQEVQYGLWPFRHLIRKREVRLSIISIGPKRYLDEIRAIDRRQNDVLVIPGAQSSPFYYWTGNPFRHNLTLNDYRKEMLLVGIDRPEEFKSLPILHNGMHLRNIGSHLPLLLLLSAVFCIGLFLSLNKRRPLRITGIFLCVITLLLLIDHQPFRSSAFSPYNGDPGEAPYQALINAVTKDHGLIFWAHPESNYADRGDRLGPVRLHTAPYPDALLKTTGYTGFSAIYGDTSHTADPGHQWDRALMQYCQGGRKNPVWAIAGADYHEDSGGDTIATYQTVILAPALNEKAVVNSLRIGRMYAVLKGAGGVLRLSSFEVDSVQGNESAGLGGTLQIPGAIFIRVGITSANGDRYPIEGIVVRDGHPWKRFKTTLPATLAYPDNPDSKMTHYYRLIIRAGKNGVLDSNPIFVSR